MLNRLPVWLLVILLVDRSCAHLTGPSESIANAQLETEHPTDSIRQSPQDMEGKVNPAQTQKCDALTCEGCVQQKCFWCDTSHESPEDAPGCIFSSILCTIAHGVVNECVPSNPSKAVSQQMTSLASVVIFILGFF